MRGFFAAIACFCLTNTGKSQTAASGSGAQSGTFTQGTIYDLSGDGPVIMSSGILTLFNNNDSTYSGSLSALTGFIKGGTATLTLTGTGNVGNRFQVGYANGGGTVALTGDAFFNVSTNVSIGLNYAGQDGALTLSGNSIFNVTVGNISVGNLATGRLEITDNAIVSLTDQPFTIGGDVSGGTGAIGLGILRIDGNGGLIVNNNVFQSGYHGVADIEVMGSGSIIATNQINVNGTGTSRIVVGENGYITTRRIAIGTDNSVRPMNSVSVLIKNGAYMEITNDLLLYSGTMEVTGNAKLTTVGNDIIGYSKTGTAWMILSAIPLN